MIQDPSQAGRVEEHDGGGPAFVGGVESLSDRRATNWTETPKYLLQTSTWLAHNHVHNEGL